MTGVHGTRVHYQHGCRCLRCKAANATYSKALYALHAHGKQPLGHLVPAGPTWKQIEALKIEGLSYGQMATRLGLRWPTLRLHTARITLRTKLKVGRIYDQLVEGADGPREPIA